MSEPASIGTTELEEFETTTTMTIGGSSSDAADDSSHTTSTREKVPIEAASNVTSTTTPIIGQPPRVVVEYKTRDELFATLCRLKADTFAIEGEPNLSPIWIAKREDRVCDVLSGLIQKNILSVPVLLKSTKYYGFLDLMDIVEYVVHHFGSSELQKERPFLELMKEEKTFESKTVGELMESPFTSKSRFESVDTVHRGYSAFAVIEALCRGRAVHRVPIIDSERKIVNLVTQSQAIRWLNDHQSLIGTIGEKAVGECAHLVNQPVLSVTEDAPAIDAFNLMVEHEVQGVAICSVNGRLRGNLSLRDLKLCGADMQLFWRLHQTVKRFVLKLRAEFHERHKRPRQVVYVTPSTKLHEVLSTLARHAIHRVYICNNHQEKRAIGVITLRDLILEIVNA